MCEPSDMEGEVPLPKRRRAGNAGDRQSVTADRCLPVGQSLTAVQSPTVQIQVGSLKTSTFVERLNDLAEVAEAIQLKNCRRGVLQCMVLVRSKLWVNEPFVMSLTCFPVKAEFSILAHDTGPRIVEAWRILKQAVGDDILDFEAVKKEQERVLAWAVSLMGRPVPDSLGRPVSDSFGRPVSDSLHRETGTGSSSSQ